MLDEKRLAKIRRGVVTLISHIRGSCRAGCRAAAAVEEDAAAAAVAAEDVAEVEEEEAEEEAAEVQSTRMPILARSHRRRCRPRRRKASEILMAPLTGEMCVVGVKNNGVFPVLMEIATKRDF